MARTKRLLRRAEGFWAAPGQPSADGLHFLATHLDGDVTLQLEGDMHMQYSVLTANLTVPLGDLTSTYGDIRPDTLNAALQDYGDALKPAVLTKLTESEPNAARGLNLTSFDVGVTLDGMFVYVVAVATANNVFVPYRDYPYYWNS